MNEKQKWLDRLEFVTRNITASMDATDRDVRELANRVAALERSISSDSAGQSADLRTYIYDIVWRELEYDGDDFCGHLADVLIRDLQLEGLELEREFSIGDDDDGRVLWLDGEEPITPHDGEVVECRWVSPWVKDGSDD